ncbi:hypothetical protein DFH11DRAFT_1877079 [Phellopilus nigrolimitatus]|nr:hypothetical protein DFH11DRAFT_1877079 [Phellopilus nigrolimitatus]
MPRLSPKRTSCRSKHSYIDFPSLRRTGTGGVSSPAPPAPIDDGTYVFKFSTPSKRTHRFQARHDDIEHLHEVIEGKLEADPFFAPPKPDAGADADADVPLPKGPRTDDFQVYYKDTHDVYVSSEDVSDAVKSARRAGVDCVVLFLHGGESWVVHSKEDAGAKAAPEAGAPKEARHTRPRRPRRRRPPHPRLHGLCFPFVYKAPVALYT